MLRRRLLVSAAVLIGALPALPAAAAANGIALPDAMVSAVGEDGTAFILRGDLTRRAGRHTASFSLQVNPPAQASGGSGTVLRQARMQVAVARKTVVADWLECSNGGAHFVYGTGGKGLRRVVAVAADGRRFTLRRFRVAGYGGSLFMRVLPARVGLLGLRAQDAAGRQVVEHRYWPPGPCRGTRFPEPPEPTSVAHRPDPDLVSGRVARDLERAERRWRRVRLPDYGFQRLSWCHACLPAPVWRSHLVRRGDPVGTSLTVDDLFGSVRRAMERRPAQIRVEYNVFGVPRRLYVDDRLSVIGGEFGRDLRRFRAR